MNQIKIQKGDWVEITSRNGHLFFDQVSKIDMSLECIQTKRNGMITLGKYDVCKVNVLSLTLSALPFEVMVTEEKSLEFRKPSDWMKSRLYDKDTRKKHYDYVRFTHGYGSDKPYFVARYIGFSQAPYKQSKRYSNGLSFIVNKGDFILRLGEIVERGNIV